MPYFSSSPRACVFLRISTCHFGCTNRCICLLAVGAPRAVSPNSGRCPGSGAAIVCQSGNAADGLSGPPSCGVLFFSCLILSSQIPFISSSVPPATLQSSSPVTLRETFFLHAIHPLHSSLISRSKHQHAAKYLKSTRVSKCQIQRQNYKL